MSVKSSRSEKVTILDVARRADVSPTTVSHALNGRGRMAEGTRERIVAVADEMGYRANPAARALKTGRSMTLLAELPDTAEVNGLDSAFLRDVLVGAAERAVESGYLLAVTGRSFAEGRALPPADGALVVDPTADDPLLAGLGAAAVPVVAVSRPSGGRHDDVPAIVSDYAAGVREILDHLEREGYREPVMLTTRRDFDFAVASADGMREWMDERGRKARFRYVSAPPSVAGGRGATRKLLSLKRRPDAIVATTEPLAMGAYQAIQGAHLDLPGDIGLAAVVDSDRLRTAAVPVTALDVFPLEIGRRAISALVEMVEAGEGEGRTGALQLPTRLHLRASTKRR